MRTLPALVGAAVMGAAALEQSRHRAGWMPPRSHTTIAARQKKKHKRKIAAASRARNRRQR